MSDTMKAMTLLIDVFNRHSGKEGDKNTLNKAELKELIEKEFGDTLAKANDKAALDRIFQDLDRNKDNSVDFSEFITLICCLTQMCHQYFLTKK